MFVLYEQVVLKTKVFKWHQPIIIFLSTWKRKQPFIWINFIPSKQRNFVLNVV